MQNEYPIKRHILIYIQTTILIHIIQLNEKSIKVKNQGKLKTLWIGGIYLLYRVMDTSLCYGEAVC